MIQYKELKVFIGKKKVGEIKRVDGGFQYFPKGKKIGGDVFATLAMCQKSLEG